jgi:septal ring factor EnvC (AmiA/AmiB activator)
MAESFFFLKEQKMKPFTLFMLLIIIPILALLFCSCSFLQRQSLAGPDGSGSAYVEDSSIARRFADNPAEKTTAVESAIELSQKYAALSSESADIKQKNRRLEDENARLNQKADELNKQLLQTQKELTEANDLLVNMRVELNNWRTNILGFRDEIRQADSEQLKALIKILELLGGQVQTNPAADSLPAQPDSHIKKIPSDANSVKPKGKSNA